MKMTVLLVSGCRCFWQGTIIITVCTAHIYRMPFLSWLVKIIILIKNDHKKSDFFPKNVT